MFKKFFHYNNSFIILFLLVINFVSATTTTIYLPDLYDTEIKYKNGVFDKVDTGKLKAGSKIGGTYDWERGFLQFDTSTIPTDSVVNSATLGLTVAGIRTSALNCNISLINISNWFPIDSTDWSLTGTTINASYVNPATAVIDTTYYQDVTNFITKGGMSSYKLQADVESSTLDCQADFYEFGDAMFLPNLTIDYSIKNISVNILEPANNIIILKNNSFQFSCNMTNNGEINFTNSNLYARYTDTTIIPTTSGQLTLNESGNYSCGALNINDSCSHSWTVNANSFADNLQIECYGEANPTSSSPLTVRVDVVDNVNNNLSIQLDKNIYSGGETSTATITSSFTNVAYNTVWFNSTGGLLCNVSGTTPAIANQQFFDSCLLTSTIQDQENNTVIFYISGNTNINVSDKFNTSTIGTLEYAITNVLLKYDETFLGYSQSIKGTVVDNNTEYAVGECCRIQIDDPITYAPIFTSEVEIIDGTGSCETHWTLDKEDFEAPKSYSAMVIAWQCSDEDLPADQRKKGTTTTSFDVEEYFTESNSLLPITNTNLYAGIDSVSLTHERTNNFGQPMSVVKTVWFANVDTEQDYHFTELRDMTTTVNVGLTTVTEEYAVPITLPTGTYRIEEQIYYSYQGDVKEFRFIKSEDFNITSFEDTFVINNLFVKDLFDNTAIESSNITYNSDLPQYFVVYGLPFKACVEYTNNYNSKLQGQTISLAVKDYYTNNYDEIVSGNGESSFFDVESGNGIACQEFTFPNILHQESSNLWEISAKVTYGNMENKDFYSEASFYDNFLLIEKEYFFGAKIDEVIQIPKWWVKPNETYTGDPGVWVQNEFGEIIPIHDDPQQKSQSQVPWGTTENCTKEDQSVNFTCDYTSYLRQGGKIKTCFKAKNYFSDEIYLNVDKLYIDEDIHDTVVELPLIYGYIENGLKSVYDPDITGCGGTCTNQSGFTYFCTEYYDLPVIMPGGNSWDVQGWFSLGRNFGETNLDWTFESDEWALSGIKSGEGFVEFNSPLTTVGNTFSPGDVILTHFNVTSFTKRLMGIKVLLETSDGIEVYTWNEAESIDLEYENEIIDLYYPLLLPLQDDNLFAGEHHLYVTLYNLLTGEEFEYSESNSFNITTFNAVVQENITSSIINNSNPITIDYSLNIPTKDMMFYPNKNQPFRIKYHFISDNGSGVAISQFDSWFKKYSPFEVETIFPAGTTQNLTTTITPKLEAGVYLVTQEFEIDGEVIHQSDLGSITVSEDLIGNPTGLKALVDNQKSFFNSFLNLFNIVIGYFRKVAGIPKVEANLTIESSLSSSIVNSSIPIVINYNLSASNNVESEYMFTFQYDFAELISGGVEGQFVDQNPYEVGYQNLELKQRLNLNGSVKQLSITLNPTLESGKTYVVYEKILQEEDNV